MLFYRWVVFVTGIAALLDISDLGAWVSGHLAATTLFFYGAGALFAAWHFTIPPKKLIQHADRSEALSDFIGTTVLSTGMVGIPILLLIRLKWAI